MANKSSDGWSGIAPTRRVTRRVRLDLAILGIVVLGAAGLALFDWFDVVEDDLSRRALDRLDEILAAVLLVVIAIGAFALRRLFDLKHDVQVRETTEALLRANQQDLEDAAAESRRGADRLSVLRDLSRAIRAAGSVSQVAEAGVESFRRLVDADRISLMLFDRDGETVRVAYAWESRSLGPEMGAVLDMSSFSDGSRPAGKETRIINDLAAEADRSPNLEGLLNAGIRSVMTTQLLVGGRVIGQFNLASMAANAFDSADGEIAREVADELTLAVQQTDLRDDLARRTRELEALLEDLSRIDALRRRLLERLMSVEGAERRAIAEDIHDDPVQAMAAVAIRLGMLKSHIQGEDLAWVTDLEQAVQGAIDRLRKLIFELHPPELANAGGLQDALQDHLRRASEEMRCSAALEDLLGRESEEVDGQTSAIAYRVALEALANIRKHSRSSTVKVRLQERDAGMLVRIEDDGVGFDPNASPPDRPGHLGLASMRERVEFAGGSFRVDSAPGEGTVVEYWLPTSASMG